MPASLPSLAVIALAVLLVLPTNAQQRPFVGLAAHTDGFNTEAVTALTANPYIEAITFKLAWADLEPTEDAYQWATLDTMLQTAADAGKRINLGILTGFEAPLQAGDGPGSWLRLKPGIQFFDQIRINNKGPANTALPWNEVYMSHLEDLITDLAEHLKSKPYYDAIFSVAVSGQNYLGEEMFAPHVVEFNNAGFSYSYQVVYENWAHWIDYFNEAFPEKKLRLTCSPSYSGLNGFMGYEDMVEVVAKYFVRTVGARGLFQTDALDGRKDSKATEMNELLFDHSGGFTDGDPARTPAYPVDQVANNHETIGSFRRQPYRQGRPEMTIYNHKAMGHPAYIQLWSGDAGTDGDREDDGLTAAVRVRGILRAWYQYRNMTAVEIQADLSARGLFLATSDYGKADSAPEAFDQLVTTKNDTAVSFNLRYTDPRTPKPSSGSDFTITQSPEHGTLSDVSSPPIGHITYTPTSGAAHQNVRDTFRWTVTDGETISNFAVTTIEIGTVGHDPYFSRDPIASRGAEPPVSLATIGTAYTGSISGLATDADAGASLTFSRDSGPAWLTVGTDGGLSGLPSESDVGENRWVVAVTDESGRVGYATLVVNVASQIDSFATFIAYFGMGAAGAPDVDSDADGISNLLEFVLGGNPVVPDVSVRPQITRGEIDGIPVARFSFVRRKAAASVPSSIEVSEDLLTWLALESGTAGVSFVIEDVDTNTERLVVNLPLSTFEGFIRLRVDGDD